MLKRDREKIQKEVEFLIDHDIARLSRASGLVGKVLDNLKDVNEDHIAVPIKLYCSKYEIQSVKYILERINLKKERSVLQMNSKKLKDNWNELEYQPEKRTVGNMEQTRDFLDKVNFSKMEVENKIKKSIPPEQAVAMRLYLYGVTCEEFNDIKEHLDISDPIRVKILNYLQDEYRAKRKK